MSRGWPMIELSEVSELRGGGGKGVFNWWYRYGRAILKKLPHSPNSPDCNDTLRFLIANEFIGLDWSIPAL